MTAHTFITALQQGWGSFKNTFSRRLVPIPQGRLNRVRSLPQPTPVIVEAAPVISCTALADAMAAGRSKMI